MMKDSEFFIAGYYSKEACIRCPRCKGSAVLDTPWVMYRVRKVASPRDTKTDFDRLGYTYVKRGDRGGRWVLFYEDMPSLEDSSYYHSGNYLIVERYPNVLRVEDVDRSWSSNKGPYILKCTNCHLLDSHILDWPNDAYYQWDIRGHILWAFSRAHAQALLEFIRSYERDETQFGYHARNLKKLPTHFISAKVRDLIVKKISATLSMESVPSASKR